MHINSQVKLRQWESLFQRNLTIATIFLASIKGVTSHFLQQEHICCQFYRCTFIDIQSTQDQGNPSLLIDIDFWVEYTAVAYSLGIQKLPVSHDVAVLAENINIRNWPNLTHQYLHKTPRVINSKIRPPPSGIWGGNKKKTGVM